MDRLYLDIEFIGYQRQPSNKLRHHYKIFSSLEIRLLFKIISKAVIYPIFQKLNYHLNLLKIFKKCYDM